MNNFLIYGANGYTGKLIAAEAVRRGLRPILAGRNASEVQAVAARLELECRVFALNDPVVLDNSLRDIHVVLHCAGPFVHTAQSMADGCLRAGAHYLDITGEIEVFEAIAARDARARERGVMLMPGVGFDVVPSDCLAAHLQRRLPSATHLALAICSGGRVSRGTATTILENMHKGGMVRRGGKLQRVPTAWKTREIDFGRGPMKAITIPWGDVSTAYHSTGIPNIEVYMTAPTRTRIAARFLRYLGWLLRVLPVKSLLRKRIRSGPPGPSDEERAAGWTLLWGEATDDAGQRVVARLSGPDGYTFTALTAVDVVQRVLAGDVRPGFQTPSLVYGPDLVLDVPGVQRTDE